MVQTGSQADERTEETVAKKQTWKEKMEDIEQSKTEKNEREYWRKITELAGWKKGRGRKFSRYFPQTRGR